MPFINSIIIKPNLLRIIILTFSINLWMNISNLGYSESATITSYLMGTNIEIKILDKDKSSKYLQKVEDEAISLMKRLELKFSKFEPESELNILNNSAGKEVIMIENMLGELLNRAINWSNITNGAFDITVSPLAELWGFGTQKSTDFRIPAKEEIDKVKTYVGFDKVKLLNNKMVKFNSEKVKIDLSGIAKGFIVDKTLEFLKQAGIENSIINAGGDIYCLGKGPLGRGWNIGIQHPRKISQLIAKINLEDKAIATSGDYQNFFFYKGERFSHIIDPRTGYPVNNSLISATIIAPNCTDADALATAVMVLGKDKALELINNLKDIEAVIICEDMNRNMDIFISDGLKGKIELLN